MAQHGITLPPRTLELLTKLDEGWAAGLRLAAISIGDHPDPGQFIKELAAENSAVAGYLIEEALNNQPPEIRDLLLKTSILDRVNSGIAGELTGHEQARVPSPRWSGPTPSSSRSGMAGTATTRCSPKSCA